MNCSDGCTIEMDLMSLKCYLKMVKVINFVIYHNKKIAGKKDTFLVFYMY